MAKALFIFTNTELQFVAVVAESHPSLCTFWSFELCFSTQILKIEQLKVILFSFILKKMGKRLSFYFSQTGS